MIKKALFVLFFFLGMFLHAQNWAPLDTGIKAWFPRGLLADTANNNLIAFGSYYPSVSLPSGYAGFTVWNNTIRKWEQWYPNIPTGMDWGTLYFNNKVITFSFYYENSDITKPRTAILRFSNATDLDTLLKLNGQWLTGEPCLYQGKLVFPMSVAGDGSFNPHGLASFNGSTFTPIGDPSWTTSDNISCPTVYNNELYAILYSGGNTNLVHLTMSGWQVIPSTGFYGSNRFFTKLIVYKNRLYVCGGFWQVENSNNPGNGIAAWDGVKWDNLGGGILNSFQYLNGSVNDALVHKGRLFIAASFNKISGVKGNHIASWNDSTWCTYGHELDSCTFMIGNVIECLKDTIYFGTAFNKVINTLNYGYVAQLRNQVTDSCSGNFSIGINEFRYINQIKIYPNPVSNILHIESEQYFEAVTEIEIVNALGQTVLKLGFSNEVDLTSLSSGYYTLKVISPNNPSVISKFIKE